MPFPTSVLFFSFFFWWGLVCAKDAAKLLRNVVKRETKPPLRVGWKGTGRFGRKQPKPWA